MSCTLYILKSQVRETYYTGVSDQADTRSIYHNAESKGYTQRYRPWKIVYTKLFPDRKLALKAERIIKKWKSKKMIRLLIDGTIDIENYL
jgi:putative endonuclease